MSGIKYRHFTKQQFTSDVRPQALSCTGGFLSFGTVFPHGLTTGDLVRFTGFEPSGLATINGFHTVTVTGTNTFDTDIPCTGVPADPNGVIQNYGIQTFVELFPLGFKEFTNEQVEGEIFTRLKMNDELTFINDRSVANFNFDYFLSIENGTQFYLGRCDEMQYYIMRSCDNGETYEPYWFGYFAINDGSFDLDNCKFKTKIQVDDEYRCLLENGDKEINILQADSVTIPVDYSPVFEFSSTCSGSQGPLAQRTFNGCIFPALQGDPFPTGTPLFTEAGCITGGVGWQLYTNTYLHLGGGVFDVDSTYIRETNTTYDIGGSANPPVGTGWINIGSTTLGGQPATNWARTPGGGIYTTYNWTVNLGTCVFTGQLDIDLTTIVTYEGTGRLMEDVVNFVSEESCPLYTGMRSDFFEINPPGDTPGYVAGDNYVTGTTNRIDLLAFIQKSDFLNPTATQRAVKGILTFNQVMTVFKEVFQAFWFIENEQIRIEHISWFTQTQAFDLTSATYLKFVNGKNKYSYVKEKMPKEENFKWTEAGNPDFLGFPILYTDACINQAEIKNTTIQNVVTDIEWIRNHSTGSSQEGFVLVATEPDGGDYAVMSEVGLISGLSLPNNHLSLGNLLYNYFRHNRVLLSGIMNNNAENFFTAIKTKKQVPISFPFCCDDELIPEESTILTPMGSGYLQNGYTLRVKDNMLTTELVYD